MKLNDEPEDGLWMFADIMCGTLGIVMLLALFFVLQAAAGSGGLRLSKDSSLHSDLSVERLIIARKRVETTSHPAQGTPDPAALRRVELEILEGAAETRAETYRDRIRRAREEFVQQQSPAFRLPIENEAPPTKWFYLLVRNGVVHPLHTLRNGAVVLDTERNSVLTAKDTGKQRFLPRSGFAWDPETTREQLELLARQIQGIDACQLVLLVNPDSFPMARDLVRVLDQTATLHSWMPFLPDGDFTLDPAGVLPPGARR